MKKCFIIFILLFFLLTGCTQQESSQLTATTLPVWEFTTMLCDGSGISVSRMITENVSCLHDYTLQVSQIKAVEHADAVICNGLGLEDFLEDVLSSTDCVINASKEIAPICNEAHHEGDHHHEADPHIWLSPENAKQMCKTICAELCVLYPEHSEIF
jgi:ABC-type Zn uptake system ZnuABC Zn-binding protein ZnuA